MIPRGGNTSKILPRLTSPVLIVGGTSVPPTRTGVQEIISPSGPISTMEVRNDQPFHTSINVNSAKNGDPTPTFSKLIGRELSNESSADIYSHCRVNFTRDAALTKIPNFMNLGLSSVQTSDELGSFNIPATRIRRPTDVSNWLPSGHLIGVVTADRMNRTRSEKNYSSKTYFETRR